MNIPPRNTARHPICLLADHFRLFSLVRAEVVITVSEASRRLGIPRENVSYGFRLLRRSGILASAKRGRFVDYRLSEKFAADGGSVEVDDGVRLVLPGL